MARDKVSLWTDAVAKAPQMALGHINLAGVNAALGRPDYTTALYQQAIEIQPENPDANFNFAKHVATATTRAKSRCT